MKIGFDAKRLYNNFTGLGNYSRTLISNLLNFYPEEEYFLYTPKIAADPALGKFLENPRLKTRLAKTPFRSFWRSYSIMRDLKRDEIEIYHGLSGETPLSISGSGIKNIVTIHDLIFLIYPETYKPADRFFYDRKFRHACRNADLIIAISQCTKSDLAERYGISPDRIRVVYQSCDPVFYTDPDTDMMKNIREKYLLPENFILYVGSVITRKNLLSVVKALDILPLGLKIPLVVVGGGKSYKKMVREFIEAKNLDRYVIWIENLHDSNQLKAFYNLSSIFVYPSVYEGFGIPVAEALLSSVPVITSSVSSLPEAGGPDSCLVEPENAEEIAYRIEKILTDTRLRKNMVTEGLRYALKTFSPESTARQMHECYRDLLI